MTKTYTLAEIKAMDAAIEVEEAGRNGTNLPTVPVVVAGTVINAPMPEIYRSLIAALPIVVEFFGDTKASAVSADTLHRRVGGTYKKGAWLKRVIDDCRLVEGVDYIQTKLNENDPDNAQAFIRDGRLAAATSFTPKAAAKVISRSNADEAHTLFDFMYAVVDASAPYLIKELALKNAEINNFNLEYNAGFKKSIETAKSLGFDGRTQMINQINEIKVRDDLITQLREEGAKAVGYKSLERLIEKAAGHLHKVKNNPDKVIDAASELLEGLGQINNGNVGYCSSF